MEDLIATLTGRPVNLLAFDDVREKLQLRHVVNRGVQEVPLERIVGTIGRHREFNRAFLPREESLRERWQDMEQLAEGPRGFPSVELYKVGDAYFVVDGHHRVSVLRALGAETIEARVKEFVTHVPVTYDEPIEETLLRSGLQDLLEATGLAPDGTGDFTVSEPSGYERLLEHINVHRYFRSIEEGYQVSWPDAVASWRDTVYRPMIEVIRSSGILEEFPGRTETDLYLFTMDHLHHLRQRYPHEIPPERAVKEVLAKEARKRARVRRSRSFWARLRAALAR